jgi:membrane protease YdiL (CAAX protease family)
VQDADPIAAPVGEQVDDTVRWGLGDAVVGWLLAQVGAILAMSVVLAVTGDDFDDLSIGAIALAQTGMWLGMFGVPWVATRLKGHGLVRDLGLVFRPWDVAYVALGAVCQYALVLVYLPLFWLTDVDAEDLSEPARNLTDRAHGGLGVVLLILIVGIGAPVFEEIFYRGLVQRSIVRRLGRWPGVVITAVVFGAVHFQALQFVSLALFGGVLGVLALRSGRLGPSIAAHMGFNLVAAIGLVLS